MERKRRVLMHTKISGVVLRLAYDPGAVFPYRIERAFGWLVAKSRDRRQAEVLFDILMEVEPDRWEEVAKAANPIIRQLLNLRSVNWDWEGGFASLVEETKRRLARKLGA